MPDLEQRVSTLEREMASLKARVDAGEEDAANIPELIKTEFRLSNSQMARLSRDVAELKRQVGELGGEVEQLRELPAKVNGLESKVDALPRIVAELVVELLDERDRKR
jgi:outer membrane murein-binding lipoprotein Lpp